MGSIKVWICTCTQQLATAAVASAKMMLPQRILYLTLWCFYVFALSATILQIGMTLVMIILPEQMIWCFVYANNTMSIVHSCMCSCMTACGYIAAATMHQIRCSIQVILQAKTVKEAKKDIKRFDICLISLWVLN